jgi:cysteine sulfinate desulfinase/cysteine desulfurase-like protein
VITQATEHPAVLDACRALHRRYGTEVTYRPVGPGGQVDRKIWRRDQSADRAGVDHD